MDALEAQLKPIVEKLVREVLDEIRREAANGSGAGLGRSEKPGRRSGRVKVPDDTLAVRRARSTVEN